VLLADFHLEGVVLDDEGVVDEVLIALTLHLVVLETLGEEEDALKCEHILTGVPEIVAANLHLVFELGSVLGMERRLSIQKLE
jgi:hypothetical protein